ncbi:hypothetical protein Sxan_22430 [Streptomyces xanthophaeus]|uniref:Uncharacterized protein n=1 Tax=Streptomyces xanthophaeus TaxID=67385 RepID=A0A919H021_9ACTN|nr:hypothetical protein Sxan_22430 [Streptomyces xanthophaeus]
MLLAALRGPAAQAGTVVPSTTHGPGGRRRRSSAPDAPVIGVSTGSTRSRITGSSAQWPSPAPAGDRGVRNSPFPQRGKLYPPSAVRNTAIRFAYDQSGAIRRCSSRLEGQGAEKNR